MNKAIFFDINGTIIERDHRTDLPYSLAINKLLNTTHAMDGVDTSARSDQDVFMEVLENHHWTYTTALWQTFLDLYVTELENLSNSNIWRANVDVIEFIKYVHNKGYFLALITGELSIGAKYKLEKIGVWDYFNCGGFGEDGLKRFDIAEVALKKAYALCPKEFNEIIVIGDTKLDIQTARHINAKIVSITTGSHTRAELKTLSPDMLIDRFDEIMDLF